MTRLSESKQQTDEIDVQEERLAETFEELKDLVDLNTQNHLNFCRMGSMLDLLFLIIAHERE